MVAEEGLPALRRRASSTGHILSDAGLADLDAALGELAPPPISRRISAGTVGRPERGRYFQRRYDLNPARCHRTTVSGLTIVSALRVPGSKRYSATKIRRSTAVKFSRLGRCRRWTLS